ncbi:type 1 fimbrial protein [Pseudomonas kairouanensis]|uniref:Type 1 fimbrial protein n=1 Tax=Pseudomonas kairouanensis TaxID=2293832 RepID=A0A4Z0B183_9PSED|nr:fimbrial protein [Pseudomonas kairouanensis]TFY91958.1 type 1 fimbrial protein [Pseudomonas kairouanensis]
MKALLWTLLALSSAVAAQPVDETRIDVSGKLIAPPCSPRFPSTQQVDLGTVNISQLADNSAVATEVPLVFDCQAGSQVSLTLSAGLGSVDTHTLLTSRPALGLRFALLNKNAKADLGLGDIGTWPVSDQPLELTLQVTPVSVGTLPEAGSYNAMLLMQITYR